MDCILTATSGRHWLLIAEGMSPSEDERVFHLTLDGQHEREFSLLCNYCPGLALGERLAVIWGGVRMYFLDLSSGTLRQRQHQDEVHSVFFIEELICLIGETSIALLDPLTEVELRRYHHDDVIMYFRWVDDHLVIRDFAERYYRVELGTSEIGVSEVSEVDPAVR